MNFLWPFWHPRIKNNVKVKKLLLGLPKNFWHILLLYKCIMQWGWNEWFCKKNILINFGCGHKYITCFLLSFRPTNICQLEEIFCIKLATEVHFCASIVQPLDLLLLTDFLKPLETWNLPWNTFSHFFNFPFIQWKGSHFFPFC